MIRRRFLRRAALTTGFLVSAGLTGAAVDAQELTTIPVAQGLSSPLFATGAPNDSDRLFILEQSTARIRIVEDGSLLTTPFLDIGARASGGGERGLLGLAFHPEYESNGEFFLNYTNNSGDTVVSRFNVTGDPNVADPNSEFILMTIDQPFSNHNGGMIAFGPDGYLYIATGDGGSAGDPGNRAQDGSSLLGKMLRIDVDGGSPYGIPADNPFVNDPNFLDEIWSYGLRNPWRWSFDRGTGDMYIGDVGQFLWEEIDFQPANSAGGENYGWRLKEGNHCFNPPTNCDPGGLTDPIYEYSHGSGRCSVTGGYVYRGSSIPLLQGTYFFADYCAANIWSFRYENGNVNEFTDRTSELDPDGSLSIRSITSFGEDTDGELYIVDGGGEVFKVVTRMRLSSSDFVPGQNVTLTVGGATAGERVYFGYSLSGTGETPVPPLGVSVALDDPALIGSDVANNSGVASITQFVPPQAGGRDIWIQAAEAGNTSNVLKVQ
ncbi:MAG: PQQ-dependent sugar dehydrogenase [Phycisphaerales bacterium]